MVKAELLAVNKADFKILEELNTILGFDLEQTSNLNSQYGFELNNKGHITGISFFSCESLQFEKIANLLPQLSQLLKLNLSHSNISDLSFLNSISSLQSLDLSDTHIIDISSLKTLHNLHTLNLKNNFVFDLSSLATLRKLKKLNLSKNPVEEFSAISFCKALQKLNLNYTSISNLSPLSELLNIKVLYLHHTPIGDLLPLADLSELLVLGLSKSRIKDISPLKNLSNLKTLYLSNTKINDFLPLSNLNELMTLDLSETNISDITPLANLPSLQNLYLGKNKIVNINPLRDLYNLIKLELHQNQIKEISSLKKLKHLQKLTLWENPISTLPPWITDFNMDIFLERSIERQDVNNYSDSGFFLGNNSLQSPPPEIIQRGKIAIKSWFKDDKIFVNELKVLLVGQGGVGKTSLVKCIKGEKLNPKEPATHNINITEHHLRYIGKKIKLNFWDFGGQDVMHSTHQFFLSKRCIYILVLDGRKDEDPEYWLKHIESFGGNSPVLVVMNKIDTNPAYDVDRRFLQTKYPSIVGFFKTSCSNKAKGVAALKKELQQALDKVELLTIPWPTPWLAVKNKIESMQLEFISQKKYEEICEGNNITDSKSQQVLTDYLNDLGVVVHFNDIQLTDLHILQPRWASQAAYKIITSKQVSDNSGQLKVEWLSEILKKSKKSEYTYKNEHHRYILELMQKFELCYTINHGKEYLIPELLNIQQPELPIQLGPILKFYFQYEDLLPRSIMSRFIVRMHEDIKDNLRWRTGVVLKNELFDAMVIIIADIKERKIHISISGEQRREYFAIIRNTFFSLHKTFEKMNVTGYLPLNKTGSHSVAYKNLIGHERNQKDEYFDGSLGKSFDVKLLLDGIEPENIRLGKFQWECFLCHSSADKKTIRQIAADLKANGITYWLDEEQIQPGDNIYDKITEGLQNSRNIIPCISDKQLHSGWAKNEYQSILTKVIAGATRQRVIPLILDNTSDEKLPPLLSNYRNEKYLIQEQYERLISFLVKKSR